MVRMITFCKPLLHLEIVYVGCRTLKTVNLYYPENNRFNAGLHVTQLDSQIVEIIQLCHD